MAWNFLQGDKKPGGGLFGFLNVTKSQASRESVSKISKADSQKKLVDTSRGLAQSLLKIPETAGRSFVESRIEPFTGESFDASLDPIRKKLYGVDRLETYQTRGAGIEEKTGVPASLAVAGLAGLDLTPIGRGGKASEQLVKATTVEEVKKVLGKNVPDHVAQAISRTKDPNVIDTILKRTTKPLTSRQAEQLDEVEGLKPFGVNVPGPTPSYFDEGQGAKLMNDVVPPPGYRQRGLLKTTQEAESLTPEARLASAVVEPQTYKQMGIDPTLDKARKTTATSFDEAKRIATEGLDQGRWDANTSSHTIALIEKASREGRDTEIKELLEKAAPIATASGQANVLWRSLVNAGGPESLVKLGKRVVDDANRNAGWLTKKFRKDELRFTKEDASKLRDIGIQSRKLPDGPEKDKLLKEGLEYINHKVPPGASELVDAYRYQSLLSSPRTQYRNIFGTASSAFVIRPATLAIKGGNDWMAATLFGKERQHYLSEVPQYYKGLMNSFGDASEAFKSALSGKVAIQQPDLATVKAFKNTELMKHPIGKHLTYVPRFMEAQDKWFQTLVGAGEYNIQIAKGASKEVAEREAKKVAEYTVFRALLDPKNKTGQGTILSKIDSVSAFATEIGRKHPSFRWFVPFIRTPMNISKQMIEFSPAGFATLKGASKEQHREKVAKAMVGTAITGLGAKWAMDGNTTWDVPKDPKERELFYASGRKPYSIRIGDKWVPMIYLGPWAFAFGVPAALKDANDDSPMDASSVEVATKSVTNLAKLFSQQTYVQGISNLVDLLSGSEDVNLGATLGFTAGQATPLQGLQRYVANIVDPVFRKKPGFKESLQADIPFASKGLEPYVDPRTGEEATRNLSDYVAPYSLGAPKGTPASKQSSETELDFEKSINKIGPLRTDASEEINKAIAAGDRDRAYQIAEEYNQKLVKGLQSWIKKNKGNQNIPDEVFESIDRASINLTERSIQQRIETISAKPGKYGIKIR